MPTAVTRINARISRKVSSIAMVDVPNEGRHVCQLQPINDVFPMTQQYSHVNDAQANLMAYNVFCLPTRREPTAGRRRRVHRLSLRPTTSPAVASGRRPRRGKKLLSDADGRGSLAFTSPSDLQPAWPTEGQPERTSSVALEFVGGSANQDLHP
jgi:hypothetical protein